MIDLGMGVAYKISQADCYLEFLQLAKRLAKMCWGVSLEFLGTIFATSWAWCVCEQRSSRDNHYGVMGRHDLGCWSL